MLWWVQPGLLPLPGMYPQGLVLVLLLGVTLLSLRGGTVTALDQPQAPRPDVICENPDFSHPLQRSRVPEFPKAADFLPLFLLTPLHVTALLQLCWGGTGASGTPRAWRSTPVLI